jgi:hypothetical protein
MSISAIRVKGQHLCGATNRVRNVWLSFIILKCLLGAGGACLTLEYQPRAFLAAALSGAGTPPDVPEEQQWQLGHNGLSEAV